MIWRSGNRFAAWSGAEGKGKRMAEDGLWARLVPRLLSVLRMLTALLFIAHGAAKGFGVPAPGPGLTPTLVIAALLEPVCGVLLLLGVFSRWVAVLLSGEMALAYLIAYAPDGLGAAINQGEPVLLFCVNFLYIAAAGPGAWSYGGRKQAAAG
jgi:putative oxidoreductase